MRKVDGQLSEFIQGALGRRKYDSLVLGAYLCGPATCILKAFTGEVVTEAVAGHRV